MVEKYPRKNIKPYFKKAIFNYLNFLVHFHREDRKFEIVSYSLFKYLVITKINL